MPKLALDNGTLHFERQGQGPATLFIQGVGCIGRVWRPQVDDLCDSFDCIHYDNRGIGQSTADISRLSIEQMARDALTLLDALGVDRAHVVGHSMGGAIAVQLALLAPSRVKSLTLMCTVHRGKDVLTPTWALLRNGITTTIGSRAMRRKATVKMLCSPQFLAEFGVEHAIELLSETFERDVAQLPRIASRQIRALSRSDCSARLSELTMPKMVLAGRHDPIGRPVLAERLKAALHAERFHLFEDASHALPIERRERVNRLLREFLDSNERAARGVAGCSL
jgi:pimeloyl-ACP methyl ester carboxylesterase